MTEWHEYWGNIHMHTVHSDGTGTFDDLRAAAKDTGLHFIIATDHNVLVAEEEGYFDGLLVLVDAEIHDGALNPEGNHLLCLGITSNPVAQASDPQALIDEVHAQGGQAFLAHPLERASRLIPDIYPWHNWEVSGFQGIELWNYMSEFRYYASSRPVGLLVTMLPALFSTGPWPETLDKWDALTQNRRTVAIGGSDVHARTYQVGPLRRLAFSYRHCYRAVNTHILAPKPLTGELAADRAAVYGALRAGHCWVGYDLIGNTTGFRFVAESNGRQAIMGDWLQAKGLIRLHARLPAPAEIRLMRDGTVVSSTYGRELDLATYQTGVYRVEARRRAWFKRRGWIFSNPIYVSSQPQ